MLRMLLICLALFAASLAPHPARSGDLIFADFDPAPLDLAERRLLQAALALQGDYRGPLDGAWGPASQAAIAAYATREFEAPALNAHAAALVLAFVEEVGASGWDFRFLPDLGISLALPLDRLGPREAEEGGERRWTEDGGLTVLTHASTPRRHASGTARRSRRTPGRRRFRPSGRPTALVTRGALRDGRGFYTRSDRTAGAWATVFLAGEPDQAGALNLAANSIRPGQPASWDLPEAGRLAALVDETEHFLLGEAPAGTPDAAMPWTAAAPAARSSTRCRVPTTPAAAPAPASISGRTRW